ncbi:MAG: PorP/SprF family type IX secretion system membrane protein [Saprospiraceae bacterium]|nr:PorP/SprF family type IX secretion system membrane protein [Saprospiraceae bacterium]
MLRKYNLLVILSLLALIDLSGQDLHYSQFFNSPLNFNPGLTGVFNGDQRYQLNYRRQWQNVPVDYISADIAADFKIRSRNSDNFVGVGGLINYDKAGDLNLKLTEFNGMASYSLVLDQNNIITPGVSVSFLQRSFDQEGARTGSQWDGLAYNPTFPAEFIGEESISYLDFGAGVNYRYQASTRTYLDIGVAIHHINGPKDKFSPNGVYDSKRPQLISAGVMTNFRISKDLDILINGLYAKQDAYNEIVANVQAKVYLSKVKDKALYLGIGYRDGDAWYPMIAFDYGQVYGAFSYDMNISDFDIATDGRGGPEISLRYIFSKIPDGPYRPCPIY